MVDPTSQGIEAITPFKTNLFMVTNSKPCQAAGKMTARTLTSSLPIPLLCVHGLVQSYLSAPIGRISAVPDFP